MSTYTRILYQIVFGGKDFTNFLNEKNQDEIFRYIYGIVRNMKCHPYIIGGHLNHVHIISSVHPTVCLSQLVKDIKTSCHAFLKQRIDLSPAFQSWQVGYGGFTYDYSSLDNLIQYVKNQQIHHEKKTYVKEMEELCLENGIEFDPKYFLI